MQNGSASYHKLATSDSADELEMRSASDEDAVHFEPPRDRLRLAVKVLSACIAVLATFAAGLLVGRTTARPAVTIRRSGPKAALGRGLSQAAQGNLSFTLKECGLHFPRHLDEIEPTAQWAAAGGGVSEKEVDEVAPDMHARVVIKDSRVWLKSYRGAFHSRAQATLQSLQQAVTTAPEAFPDVEFTLGLDDSSSPNKAIWSLARRTDQPGWLTADFGFYAWPEPGIGAWSTFRDRVDEVNDQTKWENKPAQLFWRGALLSDWRNDLVGIAKEHPEWDNVRGINWGDLGQEPRVSMEDHARYRYLAGTEGGDSYSGRLKYLLSSQSVVVSHPLRWQQHWHGALDGNDTSPTQNIVFVEGPGWTGLDKTMDQLLPDPDRSRRIAENANEVFHRRYLSPAAVTCWWRQNLHAYAQTMRYEPKLDEHAKDLESVILMQTVDFEPHRMME